MVSSQRVILCTVISSIPMLPQSHKLERDVVGTQYYQFGRLNYLHLRGAEAVVGRWWWWMGWDGVGGWAEREEPLCNKVAEKGGCGSTGACEVRAEGALPRAWAGCGPSAFLEWAVAERHAAPCSSAAVPPSP